MFAIIRNNEINCFLWYKPKKEEMIFEKVIEVENFDSNKFYEYKNGEVVETSPVIIEKSKEEKIAEIKEKYKNIILGRYSITDQLNINAELWDLQDKFNSTWIVNIERLNELREAWIWIKEQRELCQSEIDAL